MRKRRLAHVASSSDEEEGGRNTKPRSTVTAVTASSEKDKAKVKEKEKEKEKEKSKVKQESSEEEEEMEEEEEGAPDLKPVGDVIKKTGRGRYEKKYYAAFELDGTRYELEDPVLVSPEDQQDKPYVAIIKDIKQARDGSIAVLGQWFYRPEEADKKGGGSWHSNDARELFYSFHRDEVPAESVMHKCVVHFIPPNKQLPVRTKHPGFIVQKVYDTVEKKLWNLTDKDYEDQKQKEIDLLVQKTRNALGELPDVVPADEIVESDDVEKNKRQLRRSTVPPINVCRDEDSTGKFEPFGRTETPGSDHQQGNESESLVILRTKNVLTGLKLRDRWLDKLLQSVKHVCHSKENKKDPSVVEDNQESAKNPDHSGDNEKAVPKEIEVKDNLQWPEAAIDAVCALEKSAYESLGSDSHKYNIKMRSLDFNLKSNAVLAKRLLKKELEPCTVLNMSPAELKDGLTAEEKTAQEPQETQTMQMADVRCSICSEKKVGVRDIIHVGYGDRYQLECLGCGNLWYASRDSISSLTIETISPVSTVGTVPSATAKFDEVEKLMSPRESDKVAAGDSGEKESITKASVQDPQIGVSVASEKSDTKIEENKSSGATEVIQ